MTAAASLSFPSVDVAQNDEGLPSTWLKRPPISSDAKISAAGDDGLSPTEKRQHKKFKPRPGSYLALGLHSQICAALRRCGYNFPTPVQRKSIPSILAGKDAVIMARTGSGKTAAYLAPVLHRVIVEKRGGIGTSRRGNGMRVLIVAPTRELALQIWKFWCGYSRGSTVRGAVIVGGEPLEVQFEALVVCPEVVIATPGRLLQLLAEMSGKGRLTLRTVEIAVFDEADRLFEGGLAREMLEVIRALGQGRESAGRQTVLVSATMPNALAEFAKTGVRSNVAVIRLDATKKLPPTLATGFFLVRADVKSAALLLILRQLRLGEEPKSTLIFVATHHRVDYLTELLRCKLRNHDGIAIPVAAVHGSMDQELRRASVSAFRQKKVGILVVTDVAARGIDLPELDVVINYEFPDTPKLFIHRVGRVARSHRQGLALSLVSQNEVAHMIDTHLVLSQNLDLVPPPGKQVGDRYAATDMSDWSRWSSTMKRTFVTGRIPRSALDEDTETIKNALLANENSLQGLEKTADNAHKMYLRSRKAASGQSVSRGKESVLNRGIGSHPFLRHLESEQDAFVTHKVNQLAKWRPKSTQTAIDAPARIIAMKRRVCADEDDSDSLDEDSELDGVKLGGNGSPGATDSDKEIGKGDARAIPVKKRRVVSNSVERLSKENKKSTRRKELEEQRARFYVPLQRTESQHAEARAMNVASGGEMGDDTKGHFEIRDAAMDITADEHMEMGKRKNVLGNKVWDRKAKKYVHPDTISLRERNFSAVRSENSSKARAGYGNGNPSLFKKWLGNNRKYVEELVDRAAAAAEGDGETLSNVSSGLKDLSGIGKNDFRKGAFGRRQRILAAARAKKCGVPVAGPANGKAKNELKSPAEIKKERKQKAKRAAKARVGQKRRQRKGGKGLPPAKGRSKLIMRRRR